MLIISTLSQLATKAADQEPYKVQFSEKELREKLSPQEYHVTQERGTERWVAYEKTEWIEEVSGYLFTLGF